MYVLLNIIWKYIILNINVCTFEYNVNVLLNINVSTFKCNINVCTFEYKFKTCTFDLNRIKWTPTYIEPEEIENIEKNPMNLVDFNIVYSQFSQSNFPIFISCLGFVTPGGVYVLFQVYYKFLKIKKNLLHLATKTSQHPSEFSENFGKENWY